VLWRELRIGFCLPRFVFILAGGLALALIWWQPIIEIAAYSLNYRLVAERPLVTFLLGPMSRG
jgi:hypothetical protein